MLSIASLGTLMVLSPHLDDGVFSCGDLLSLAPGATVVTVFAAAPSVADVLPEWDAAAGFANARQAIAARREEDRQALYRCIAGLLQQRLAMLLESGIDATPVAFDTPGNSTIKRRAVRCYRSQLRALTTAGRLGHRDLATAERYWRLTSPASL